MTDKEMIARSIDRMHQDQETMRHLIVSCQDIEEQKDKRKALRQMELFVLDNSLRESTVGQLRGHTIENKWKIYGQVINSISLTLPVELLEFSNLLENRLRYTNSFSSI